MRFGVCRPHGHPTSPSVKTRRSAPPASILPCPASVLALRPSAFRLLLPFCLPSVGLRLLCSFPPSHQSTAAVTPAGTHPPTLLITPPLATMSAKSVFALLCAVLLLASCPRSDAGGACR